MPMDKDQLKKDVEARKAQRPQAQAQQASQPPADGLMPLDHVQGGIVKAYTEQTRELVRFGQDLADTTYDTTRQVVKHIVVGVRNAQMSAIADGMQEALSECGIEQIAPYADPLEELRAVDTTIKLPSSSRGVSVQKMLGGA